MLALPRPASLANTTNTSPVCGSLPRHQAALLLCCAAIDEPGERRRTPSIIRGLPSQTTEAYADVRLSAERWFLSCANPLRVRRSSGVRRQGREEGRGSMAALRQPDVMPTAGRRSELSLLAARGACASLRATGWKRSAVLQWFASSGNRNIDLQICCVGITFRGLRKEITRRKIVSSHS